MIVFPNCKINLGLNIIGKRADGYHNLETVFYPLPFHDVLEVVNSSNEEESTELILSGNKIEGNTESNLCVKAYHLLKKDFSKLPVVKIYLHKVIPTGAGLGGGSADGAFMLLLLNDKFQLRLSQQQLINYALQLGSDCPFFILNKPSFAQQRGEVLEPIEVNLSSYKIVIINPGIHVSTSWAFTQTKFAAHNQLKEIINEPIKNWKEKLINDFEIPVFKKYPEIKNIKEQLYNSGAIYASMSGSGSTVFGVFPQHALIDRQIFPTYYFIKELFSV
ncbi:MAG: 4-(cytidine 5'-diphospho)-2-C-methyl-D-erythritol kinase [Parafilimonas sp.]|nr:4-(cytidine 5'-diphospho)-2-C-methyl-D-erythritol kinase [Parafilimonas sp.]